MVTLTPELKRKNEIRQKKRENYKNSKTTLIGLGGKAVAPTPENQKLRQEADAKIVQQRAVDKELQTLRTNAEVNKALLNAMPPEVQNDGVQTTPGVQPTQQEQVQPTLPEQKKGFLQKTAEVALTPSTYIANAVTGAFGVEHKSTAAEMASTPIGRGIGLGIAAGTVIAASAYIAGELITGITAAEVATQAVSKVGTLTKLIRNPWVRIAGGTALIGTPLKLVTDAKNAIVSSKDTANLIVKDLQDGDITLIEAQDKLRQIKQFTQIQENKMHGWNYWSLLHRLGGGIDAETDVKNAQEYINDVIRNLPLTAQEGLINKRQKQLEQAKLNYGQQ